MSTPVQPENEANPAEIVQLSDPGEVGRHEHNTGDRIVIGIGNVFAWIYPILMLAICAQVFLRSFGRAGFGPGNQAWLDDLQWWFYGTAVLVGIAYAITTNSHVRVDIFYENFSQDKKDRLGCFGLTWLLMPFLLLSWDLTVHYMISSVIANEGSDSPNGLHNLWILKILMNLSFVLMIFAAWSAYRRKLNRLIPNTPVWQQLLYAFPSTWFAINILSYYVFWWAIRLTSPAEVSNRDVGRSAIFDELEIGNHEILYTVMISLVLTIAVIAIARVLGKRAEA